MAEVLQGSAAEVSVSARRFQSWRAGAHLEGFVLNIRERTPSSIGHPVITCKRTLGCLCCPPAACLALRKAFRPIVAGV